MECIQIVSCMVVPTFWSPYDTWLQLRPQHLKGPSGGGFVAAEDVIKQSAFPHPPSVITPQPTTTTSDGPT
jgi:hypothetical protein